MHFQLFVKYLCYIYLILFYIVPSNIKGSGMVSDLWESDHDDENETSSRRIKRKKKTLKSRRRKRLNKASLMRSQKKINDLEQSSVFCVFHCKILCKYETNFM